MLKIHYSPIYSGGMLVFKLKPISYIATHKLYHDFSVFYFSFVSYVMLMVKVVGGLVDIPDSSF